MTARTVSELFPSPWLKAEDLKGQAVVVTIEAVTVENLRQFDGTQAQKVVVAFKSAKKRLILNKTQALRLAELTRSEVIDDWVEKRVTLKPAVAKNGKPTVGIDAAPAGNGNGKPQEAAQGQTSTGDDFDRLPGHPASAYRPAGSPVGA